jgi:hypothetical protein
MRKSLIGRSHARINFVFAVPRNSGIFLGRNIHLFSAVRGIQIDANNLNLKGKLSK